MLIRALFELWSRNPRDSYIAIQIEKFIFVQVLILPKLIPIESRCQLRIQYNSLLHNARTPGTDWYSSNWTGPAVPSLVHARDQLGAIDVFNSVINLADNTTSSTSSTMSPTTTSSPTQTSGPGGGHSRLSKGVVIGIVVSGVLCALLVIMTLGVIWRRVRRRSEAHTSDDVPHNDGMEGLDDISYTIDPFLSISHPAGMST